jgi:hypothetical protein
MIAILVIVVDVVVLIKGSGSMVVAITKIVAIAEACPPSSAGGAVEIPQVPSVCVIVAIWRTHAICAKMRPFREAPVKNVTSVCTYGYGKVILFFQQDQKRYSHDQHMLSAAFGTTAHISLPCSRPTVLTRAAGESRLCGKPRCVDGYERLSKTQEAISQKRTQEAIIVKTNRYYIYFRTRNGTISKGCR